MLNKILSKKKFFTFLLFPHRIVLKLLYYLIFEIFIILLFLLKVIFMIAHFSRNQRQKIINIIDLKFIKIYI